MANPALGKSPATTVAESAPVQFAWFEWAVILAVFFVVGGAPPPHVNETHYLTKAKHYWDASYCPGDYFLNSADPHLAFYWMFGWMTRLVSLPATAWIGRLIAWSLIAAGWLRILRAVLNVPWTAALSAAVWVALVEKANFAGEWAVGGVEAKSFAYALVFFGLAAMLRGNWRTPWIWFGAASALHVLVGAWAVLGGLAVLVTEPRGTRPSLRTVLPGLLVGGLLSLPGLLPALALQRGADPATAGEAARIYVFERLPHHLAPLSLSAEELRRRAARFAVVVAAFLALWSWQFLRCRRPSPTNPEVHSKLDGNALGRLMRFAAFALLCEFAGLAIELALKDEPSSAARVLRYYWFRQADITVPLAVSVALAALIVWLHRRRAWLGFLLAGTASAGCLWFLGSLSLARLENPQPPATARLERFADWEDACTWISEQAPPDARFLIPRMGHSFKWYASRADVANYKDVPQDAESVVQWRARCADVFPTVEINGKPTLLSFPDQLGVKRLREVARKYGASHVITRRYPPLDLKVVYPEKERRADCYWTVYETGESTTAAP